MNFLPSYVLLPVPHRQQQHESDCLAACADMVLTYMAAPVKYKRLLKVLRVDTTAGTPFPMIRNLASLGITVVLQKGTLERLHNFLKNGWPCIVPVATRELPYWKSDTDHAVVVIGMDEQTVYLHDPAFPTGTIQVSHGDFDLAWFEHDEYYAILAP